MKKITTLFGILLFVTLNTPVISGDLDTEEIISRQEERVASAAPDDWKTYAECANNLISRRIVTGETIDWIERSIHIRETVYNRTVKGDYLVLQGKIREAQAEYVRAIELAKLENRKEEIDKIQWKIMISMGVDNYNKFQAESR